MRGERKEEQTRRWGEESLVSDGGMEGGRGIIRIERSLHVADQ